MIVRRALFDAQGNYLGTSTQDAPGGPAIPQPPGSTVDQFGNYQTTDANGDVNTTASQGPTPDPSLSSYGIAGVASAAPSGGVPQQQAGSLVQALSGASPSALTPERMAMMVGGLLPNPQGYTMGDVIRLRNSQSGAPQPTTAIQSSGPGAGAADQSLQSTKSGTMTVLMPDGSYQTFDGMTEALNQALKAGVSV